MNSRSALPVPPTRVLADCWCLAAQRAARRLARLYDDGLRPFGLSHGQFSLLMLVAGHPAGANVGQLAEALVMDRTTVTAALKPLERRALLHVASAAEDLRQRRITLTARGQALLAEATAAWQALQAQVRKERLPSDLRPSLRQLAVPTQESET